MLYIATATYRNSDFLLQRGKCHNDDGRRHVQWENYDPNPILHSVVNSASLLLKDS